MKNTDGWLTLVRLKLTDMSRSSDIINSLKPRPSSKQRPHFSKSIKEHMDGLTQNINSFTTKVHKVYHIRPGIYTK